MASIKRSTLKSSVRPVTAPAEGERRALRGYVGQYERAGAAIYAALERGELLWIGVADRNAGNADDLVLGFDGLVVGHQFKTSKFPSTFTVETLFTGANGLLKPLVHAWQCLSKDNPGSQVEIRLVVNDFPSITDKPGDGTPPHSAAFLEELQQHANRPLVLLCHKRSLAFARRQHGHRGSVLSKAAAISSRKLVMDDGTWRCVRGAAARLVMRG